MCDAPGFVAGESLGCRTESPMTWVFAAACTIRVQRMREWKGRLIDRHANGREHMKRNARTPQRNEETVAGREKFAARAQRRKIAL
jgi:hypothetical protein